MSSSPVGSPKRASEPPSASADQNTEKGDSMDPEKQPSAADGGVKTESSRSGRRSGVGAVSSGAAASAYAANKMPHLKKEDGVPLWRKDIQYQFLRYVFEDEQPVFHKLSDGSDGHSFADIYLDAMAQSSKCSKILKDKLLTDRPAAINMAMVCLLVNIGRINTTLNFFPEMRAQLRTYHSIPSLQAHQDFNNYKQLQDAPRLKSILKGATEDIAQPSTLDEIKATARPRTNPVNLVFVLAQYAPKVTLLHFDSTHDLFDLVMKHGLSSRSRATAFLWLMWWYLESDFSAADATANPFGPGRPTEDETGLPIRIPDLDQMTEEEEELENVDTADEIEFGELKQRERARLLTSRDEPPSSGEKEKRTGKTEVAVSTPTPIQKRPRKSFGGTHVFSIQAEEGASVPIASAPVSGSSPNMNGEKSRARKRIRTGDGVESSTDPASFSAAVAGPDEDVLDVERVTKGRTGTTSSRRTTRTKDPNQASRTSRRRVGDRDRRPETVTVPDTGGTKPTTLGAYGGAVASRQATYSDETDVEDVVGCRFRVNSGTGPVTPTVGSTGDGSESKTNSRRARPVTSHQMAVERYRSQRVYHRLDRQLRRQYATTRKARLRQSVLLRAWLRLRAIDSDERLTGYDSEQEYVAQAVHLEENPSRVDRVSSQVGAHCGWAGLYPCSTERDRAMVDSRGSVVHVSGSGNWGEESGTLARALRRAKRRLDRWDAGVDVPIRRSDEGNGDEDHDGERLREWYSRPPTEEVEERVGREGYESGEDDDGEDGDQYSDQE